MHTIKLDTSYDKYMLLKEVQTWVLFVPRPFNSFTISKKMAFSYLCSMLSTKVYNAFIFCLHGGNNCSSTDSHNKEFRA